MGVRAARISPDRNSIAIRSDAAEDAWNAWGVMNALNGGYWASSSDLATWTDLTVPEEEPPAEEG